MREYKKITWHKTDFHYEKLIFKNQSFSGEFHRFFSY